MTTIKQSFNVIVNWKNNIFNILYMGSECAGRPFFIKEITAYLSTTLVQPFSVTQ